MQTKNRSSNSVEHTNPDDQSFAETKIRNGFKRRIWLCCLVAISLMTVTCQILTPTPSPISSATYVPAATQAPVITYTAPVVTVTSPPDVPSPTTAPPTKNTPSTAMLQVRVYYVAVGDGGISGIPIGCGDSLVAVEREAQGAETNLQAALDNLLANHDQYVGQSGLYNSLWQSSLHVASVTTLADGSYQVEITGGLQMGGECDTPRVQGQIEQTAQSAVGGATVHVLLNGKPISEALSLR